MSRSMYQSSIPVFIRNLNNLSHILEKGAAFASDKNIEDAALADCRLYPNMFPLTRQVQIACDMAKGAGARLAGVEVPGFDDDEQTFVELQARIEKTLKFLKSLSEQQFNGSEERKIVLAIGDMTLEFNGSDYLDTWVLPNMYFHITTAYNILRHVGVVLGKRDFLGD